MNNQTHLPDMQVLADLQETHNQTMSTLLSSISDMVIMLHQVSPETLITHNDLMSLLTRFDAILRTIDKTFTSAATESYMIRKIGENVLNSLIHPPTLSDLAERVTPISPEPLSEPTPKE